ncbi:hypothetical protein ACSXA0_09315 [Clostridium perfringens]
MDNNLEFLINTLSELRYASMQANEHTIRELMHKYNMLFLGSKFNSIYSNELLHYMKSNRNFNLSDDEFLKLIPKACKILNMKYTEMTELANLSNLNREVSCYNIILW